MCKAFCFYTIVTVTSPGHSHRLIHAAQHHTQLPEPCVEEEVKEVPMFAVFDPKNPSPLDLRTNKDRPHLKFVIESDDGFKTEADNWDGRR